MEALTTLGFHTSAPFPTRARSRMPKPSSVRRIVPRFPMSEGHTSATWGLSGRAAPHTFGTPPPRSSFPCWKCVPKPAWSRCRGRPRHGRLRRASRARKALLKVNRLRALRPAEQQFKGGKGAQRIGMGKLLLILFRQLPLCLHTVPSVQITVFSFYHFTVSRQKKESLSGTSRRAGEDAPKNLSICPLDICAVFWCNVGSGSGFADGKARRGGGVL